MNAVVSATTGVQRVGRSGELLASAEALLREAALMLERKDSAVGLEYAYRAALRVAGAWVAQTPVARRVRKPRSMWEQLRLTGAAGVGWAEQFHEIAQLRSRVSMGLSVELKVEEVEELMAKVREFAVAVQYGESLAA
ncbi:SAV_6107 family HEPN domain-containing protein [Corynebacterium gerontici]|uniref:SAV-6107-like HEPN domain-containing protein n=1 Tax=Corynebacterium gerontici TaxID=2079234 RepID=A0A3G6J495_9CORY|nr:SAV_6107 family HEPN domain-containing protein [Corynebacterium gerontici]AZA11778.1 hypothetical protein CGERO_07390 [Corynebacterium gerontici]